MCSLTRQAATRRAKTDNHPSRPGRRPPDLPLGPVLRPARLCRITPFILHDFAATLGAGTRSPNRPRGSESDKPRSNTDMRILRRGVVWLVHLASWAALMPAVSEAGNDEKPSDKKPVWEKDKASFADADPAKP